MRLREYQQRAYDAVLSDLKTSRSALVVAATGTGKTVLFGHIAKHFSERGRVLVLAHRQELIYQAQRKIGDITNELPDIEMGEMRADTGSMYMHPSKVIISTIQSQMAGQGGNGRMSRFNPGEFSLVIVDEAHHAPADSYKRVLEYYKQNPELRVLGVTATPDRSDEAALGQVFDKVSFVYEINDGISDGYLVPVAQRSVIVDNLDFSKVRTTAGDLNCADLAEVMEYESNLHGIAHPTFELSNGRKTIVFAASVAHAERLCEIFNRHEHDCARFVCAKTDDVTRKQTLRDFAAGRFNFLCNVGVLTEGFDEPTIECVAIARPTKSRALYAQMVGRGTRPLPGIAEHLQHPDDRVAAIRASAKPTLEVFDFVGNSGRHKLITTADILGGTYPDEVIEIAEKNVRDAGEAVDMREALSDAQKQLERQQAEERRRADAATRRGLIAKANYSVQTVDAFDVLDIMPERERGWHKGRKPSEKQIDMLRRNGIDNAAELSFTHATQLIQTIIERRNNDKCSLKQARVLRRYGYSADTTFAEAREIMDALAKNNWRRPSPVAAGAVEGEV